MIRILPYVLIALLIGFEGPESYWLKAQRALMIIGALIGLLTLGILIREVPYL